MARGGATTTTTYIRPYKQAAGLSAVQTMEERFAYGLNPQKIGAVSSHLCDPATAAIKLLLVKGEYQEATARGARGAVLTDPAGVPAQCVYRRRAPAPADEGACQAKRPSAWDGTGDMDLQRYDADAWLKPALAGIPNPTEMSRPYKKAGSFSHRHSYAPVQGCGA